MSCRRAPAWGMRWPGAGGLVAEADSALVNQAELLFDGAQVHVPLPQSPRAGEASSSGTGGPSAGLSGEPTTADTGASGGTAGGGLVNVNTASLEVLTTLPGIGPTKAAAIIAERPFDSVEELERVSGIGPKTVETLRPLIKVGD